MGLLVIACALGVAVLARPYGAAPSALEAQVGAPQRAIRTMLAGKKDSKVSKEGDSKGDSESPYVSALQPGAEYYYSPQLLPSVPTPPIIARNPIGQWGDIMQRMTRELSTDTMEVANLDNEVCVFCAIAATASFLHVPSFSHRNKLTFFPTGCDHQRQQ